MSVSFKGIVAKIVAAAKDFKADILKAAEEAPVIVADVEKDAPEVEALVALAFPGAAQIEQTAIAMTGAMIAAIDDLEVQFVRLRDAMNATSQPAEENNSAERDAHENTYR